MSGAISVVEGIDGSGKTTLSRRLAGALGARWMTTPGPVVRSQRDRLEAEICSGPAAEQLFYAATVVGALDAADRIRGADGVAVLDRGWATTAVYARVRGTSLALTEVERLLPRVDLTVLLCCSDGERARRLAVRGGNAGDRWSLRADVSRRLQAAYERELRRSQHGDVVVVNGEVGQVSASEAVRRQWPEVIACLETAAARPCAA